MILVDTNILLRSLQTSNRQFSVTDQALDTLRHRQETLCIAPQNVIEFWVVATRPLDKNGLGMTPKRAATEIRVLLGLFRLLPYLPQVFETWQRIVLTQGISGKQGHDAHLVAMMQVHSITSILTFNTEDFIRFPGIQVLNPAEVNAGFE